MKQSLIITLLAVLLATSIELIPSKPLITTFNRDVKVQEHKLETYEAVEIALADYKPVYCADYVKEYSWNQTVAYNVMMIESGNNARNLNDNPKTGDYSVGCFQINLLGANQTAKYNIAVKLGYQGANERNALREWLWSPGNNVAVAHHMWQGQGWTPWSFTTCKKTNCY